MNRLLRPTLTAALAAGSVLALASTAHANVEIGGIAGVHVFSNTNELGVPDTATADSEKNSALFGLRVGVFFGRMIGIEIEGGVIPSEGRQQVFDVWNVAYRAQLVVQFRNNDDAPAKLIPFAFVGGGAMSIVSTNEPNDIAKDTDPEAFVGVGAKYRVDNGWGLRGDARVLFPPSSAGTGFTEDFEILLSIYKEFGLHPPKKVTVVQGPKDSDGDGIPDNVDKCPNEPEDKDGFQDEDGCPDLDNDGDGIPDAQDKCPMQAEDKDGFQDEDGCPDPDNDGDGIPDAADKCPNEPEDKDGFQDEDGCPDPDNDNDGVLDAQDKCPDQPETKNGYQDEDGCPDEIPAKLKKFTGKVEGINFQSGEAVILASSNKTLDQAAAVLVEFKDLKMEIQGHTDDQPFTPKKGAKYNTNQELSQGRADAVRDYLVSKGVAADRLTAKGYGDTVPVEDPKDLKGGKLAAARAKNRRVEFKLISNLTK